MSSGEWIVHEGGMNFDATLGGGSAGVWLEEANILSPHVDEGIGKSSEGLSKERQADGVDFACEASPTECDRRIGY